MNNFCTNCGTKIEKDYNFCTNCGTKIDNTDINQNAASLKSMPDIGEIKKAKKELKRVVGGRLSYNETFRKTLAHNGIDTAHTRLAISQQMIKEIESGEIQSGGVEFRVNQLIAEYKLQMEKEIEEEKKKLKMIDEILESEEITSEIRKNKIDVSSIKDNLKEKLINEREITSEDEIRHFIKNELKEAKEEEKKARITKERKIPPTKIEKNEIQGGYCDDTCKYYCEEFIDDDGQISFDFTGTEVIDYYCTLGHSFAYGSFCKYYEKYV